MKLGADKLAILACGLMLGACTTYETQSASNVSRDVAVDEQAEAGSTETTTASAEEVDEDRIICKRTIATGTRFAKRECRSWREWREMQEATRSILDEGQRRNLQSDVPGGN